MRAQGLSEELEGGVTETALCGFLFNPQAQETDMPPQQHTQPHLTPACLLGPLHCLLHPHTINSFDVQAHPVQQAPRIHQARCCVRKRPVNCSFNWIFIKMQFFFLTISPVIFGFLGSGWKCPGPLWEGSSPSCSPALPL